MSCSEHKEESWREEVECIECSGTKNVILCEICRDLVCKGCMFNHNENERAEQNTEEKEGIL